MENMSPLISRLNEPIRPPLSLPNMREKPMTQNTTDPIAKSIRFFMMMLPAFLALVKPVSTIAKPACMKKTSAVATSTQTVSRLDTVDTIDSIASPPYFGY